MASNQNILTITVPPGVGPGQLLTITSPFDGQNFQVQIPTGVTAGMSFRCAAPAPRQIAPSAPAAHLPPAPSRQPVPAAAPAQYSQPPPIATTASYAQPPPTATTASYGQPPTATTASYGQPPTATTAPATTASYGQPPTATTASYGQPPTATTASYGQPPPTATTASYGQPPHTAATPSYGQPAPTTTSVPYSQPPPIPHPTPVGQQPQMAPAATPQTMSVQIPAGVHAGQNLQVRTPSGQLMMVQVPAGTAPGQVLQVQLPPPTNALQQHKAPTHQPLHPPSSSHTIPGGVVTVGGRTFTMPGLPHSLNAISTAANLHTMEEYWFDRTCKKIKIGLAWDAGCDVDSSVAMLDRNMTIVDTVSFKKLQSRCKSVKHSGDDTTGRGGGDDETIKVKLRDVPQHVTHLLFVVSVFSVGRSFAHVRRCSVRAVLDKQHQSFKPVLFKYPLSQPNAHCNAMLVCMLTRVGAFFKLTALATPTTGRTLAQVMQQPLIPPILAANPPQPNLQREVYVSANHAKDLYPQDVALFGKGKADPYVIFKLRKKKFATGWIRKNLNPVWNQKFHSPIGVVDAAEYKPLVVMVYDHDDFSDDDFMGGVTIPGAAVFNLGPGTHQISVQLQGTMSYKRNAFRGKSYGHRPHAGTLTFTIEIRDRRRAF